MITVNRICSLSFTERIASGHYGNILTDAGYVLTGMLQGILNDCPHRRGAGKGVFCFQCWRMESAWLKFMAWR